MWYQVLELAACRSSILILNCLYGPLLKRHFKKKIYILKNWSHISHTVGLGSTESGHYDRNKSTERKLKSIGGFSIGDVLARKFRFDCLWTLMQAKQVKIFGKTWQWLLWIIQYSLLIISYLDLYVHVFFAWFLEIITENWLQNLATRLY